MAVPPLPPTDGEEPKNGPEEHVFVPFVRDIVPVVNTKEGVIADHAPGGALGLATENEETEATARARAAAPEKEKSGVEREVRRR